MTESRSGLPRVEVEKAGRKGMTKAHEENSVGHEHIQYLDYNASFMGICIIYTTSNCVL